MIGTLTVIGALAGAWAGVRGTRLLLRGLAHADEEHASLDVIRGIRGVAIAVGTAALAGGILLKERWLLAFGLVFLLEELYETGVVALVLRAAQEPDRFNSAFRARGAPLPSSPSEDPPSFESPHREGPAQSDARRAASPISRGAWRARAAAGSRKAC
jgi:hypothetical protein